MDDSIKDRLQAIIAKRDADGKGSAEEREAMARQRESVFLERWNARVEEVIRPAFKAFNEHLSTTYKIASHIMQDESLGAFAARGDPNIRFVIGDPPRLGQRVESSFLEIRGNPRAQTWTINHEARDGQNLVAKSEQAPVSLDEISDEWIHEQLANLLALSYGQPLDGEEPTEEDSDDEDREREDEEKHEEGSEAESSAAPDEEPKNEPEEEPEEEANDEREEHDSEQPADQPDDDQSPAEDAERPDEEGRDSDRQKSPNEPTDP